MLIFIEDCKDGKYGKNCSISCGNCLESEQCNHINGICMNGCDSGYQGFLCIEGKVVILYRHISIYDTLIQQNYQV